MAPTKWHLDIKITAGLILTTALNLAGGVWWASQMDSANRTQDASIARLEQRQDRNESAVNGINERLARIEANQTNQTQLMQDIREGLHLRR
jgi:hypothetical protein